MHALTPVMYISKRAGTIVTARIIASISVA